MTYGAGGMRRALYVSDAMGCSSGGISKVNAAEAWGFLILTSVINFISLN